MAAVVGSQSAAQALPQLRALLVAARLWSSGSPVDEQAIGRVRSAAILANHRRYVAEIPAYSAVVREYGLAREVTVPDIRASLVMTDELFKSYDRRWLDDDLPAVTRWLSTVSTVRVDGPLGPAGDLGSWRTALKQQGVFVTFSSGTSGQPSIVPRDQSTLAALRGSCGVRFPWLPRPGSYHCLLLTAPGMGTGIQSGAAGLGAGALHVHRLHQGRPDDLRAAAQFLAAAELPVVVYGPPAALAELVSWLVECGARLRLPGGSCVVTGGGWKAGQPGDLDLLFDETAERLGVPRARCVDTYSCAELNTVFVSCAYGRYHVPPVVEVFVLDELLRPVGGQRPSGRLAVLDPFACSYPGFLTMGDVVTLGRDCCRCGLVGTTLIGPVVRAPGVAERGCGLTEAVPR